MTGGAGLDMKIRAPEMLTPLFSGLLDPSLPTDRGLSGKKKGSTARSVLKPRAFPVEDVRKMY